MSVISFIKGLSGKRKRAEDEDTLARERTGRQMLAALQPKANLGHVYAGTVSPKDKAHRRAKGKMAKASRKVNRVR